MPCVAHGATSGDKRHMFVTHLLCMMEGDYLDTISLSQEQTQPAPAHMWKLAASSRTTKIRDETR